VCERERERGEEEGEREKWRENEERRKSDRGKGGMSGRNGDTERESSLGSPAPWRSLAG